MEVPGYAVITGAASGIGLATSIAFACDGATGVALIDLSSQPLEVALEKVKAASSRADFTATTHVLDITNEVAVNETLEKIYKTFGRIDYAVNNAGVFRSDEGGVAEATTETWRKMIGVNLEGTFFCLRAEMKIMLKQERKKVSSILPHLSERGSIVNIASVQGHIAVPNNSAYVASKHGVVGLTKTASEDHVADGIRVNAVCPGYIKTPMNGTEEDWAKDIWMVERDVPQQRWGHPEEIAQVVLFLCGGRSTYISGTSLLVDGGMTESYALNTVFVPPGIKAKDMTEITTGNTQGIGEWGMPLVVKDMIASARSDQLKI